MGNGIVKVLSLYQPWATLVVLGAKKFETRSWAPPKYRGPLLIHASKRFTHEHKDLCCFEPFLSALSPVWKPKGTDGLFELPEDALPLGAIIGRVDLVECISTEEWLKRNCNEGNRAPDGSVELFIRESSAQEHAFGDFSYGRFAWQLENPVKFDEPIPARGSLGIWEFPESALGHFSERRAISR